RRIGVVNEQARQIEDTGHPGDHRDDVDGDEPGIEAGHAEPPCLRTRATRRSTCAIGVCGTMPWPRLKMKRSPASRSMIRSTALSRASPPATRIIGSRLPWTTA